MKPVGIVKNYIITCWQLKGETMFEWVKRIKTSWRKFIHSKFGKFFHLYFVCWYFSVSWWYNLCADNWNSFVFFAANWTFCICHNRRQIYRLPARLDMTTCIIEKFKKLPTILSQDSWLRHEKSLWIAGWKVPKVS